MIEKRIGPIFNVFCVGSPLHIKFAMSTLPFCLEHRQCYVVISDFKYSTDKSGNQYGWGIAEYSTPEKLFGKKFTDAVYKRSPEESYQKVLKQFRKILPGAGIEEIERILR